VLPHRLMLVCSDAMEAASALDGVESGNPRGLSTGVCEARERPVVFMFPGQGTQYVKMGRDLYETERAFRDAVDRCCELLQPDLGRDLRTVLYPARGMEKESAEALQQTDVTQPALFVVEYALAQLWREWGVRPSAMIGHSVGEYLAACLAGVFSL